MEQLARQLGGRCLSTSYKNNFTKLRWRCRAGHLWRSLPKAVKQGHWCDKCFDDWRRGNIERIQQIASKRGGKCLSPYYPNVKTPLRLRCGAGHEWRATGNALLRGSWCRICAGKAKHTLEKAQAAGRARGGECLSKTYKNALAKLRWKCSEDHEWSASLNGVLSGRWCPYCSAFLRERLVRSVFEQLFGSLFPRVRPDWLRKDGGFKMELDGFNKNLGLAFEHHGEQHYRAVKFFSASRSVVAARRRDDALKRRLCRQNRVKLIEVSYKVPLSELATFVVSQCRRGGYRVPKRAVNLELGYPVGEMKPLQRIAEARGGSCLSKTYKGSEVPLLWGCGAGHQWWALSWKIKAGDWCSRCQVNRRRQLESERYLNLLRKAAAKKGGRCVGKTFKGSQAKVEFECSFGHKWLARAANVLHHNSWCPKCWAGRLRRGLNRKQPANNGIRPTAAPMRKLPIAAAADPRR